MLALIVGFLGMIGGSQADTMIVPTDSSRVLTVNRVLIVGNKVTKEGIISREITLKRGDTISLKRLQHELLWDKRKIYNLRLFHTVTVRALEMPDGTFDLLVDVTERWYTFPIPIFELSDRNFSEWWHNYEINKLGKPVDRTEWDITTPTINAGYYPTFNKILFPAGILQFPFFDLNADDAINYGAIGMFIGHEITHGFDDQGSQYDKDGNLKNWWSKEDREKFVAKSNKVIALYNSFVILDSVHLNGALTNGENIADMGGIAIAYDAFKMTNEGQDTTKIDGFTPDQRFFLSFAQAWRGKYKDEVLRTIVNTNPHSPDNWRVLGPLMNFSPFYTAFNVQPGDKMYVADSSKIKIW